MKYILTVVLFALGVTTVRCQYAYSAKLSAQANGDDPSVSGTTSVRTVDDVLYFESVLSNAFNVTGVHLHLAPSRGAVFGGPLILALTNTTAANGLTPVSVVDGQPLIQTGTKNTTDLLANPMLPAVRSKLAELGVTGNDVANIGDVDRLLSEGLVYSDVHTTIRVSPDGLVRGTFVSTQASPTTGRKLMA